MNGFKSWILPCFATALFAAYAQAEDGEETIALIGDPDAELPEAVTGPIALPADAAAEGVDNSAEGLSIANMARDGELDGQEIAERARERGAAQGAEAAASARDARESFGRGRAAGHVPGGTLPPVPQLPQVPVTPTAP